MKNFLLISFTMILISLRKLLVARENCFNSTYLKRHKKEKVIIIEIISKNIVTVNKPDGIKDGFRIPRNGSSTLWKNTNSVFRVFTARVVKVIFLHMSVILSTQRWGERYYIKCILGQVTPGVTSEGV